MRDSKKPIRGIAADDTPLRDQPATASDGDAHIPGSRLASEQSRRLAEAIVDSLRLLGLDCELIDGNSRRIH